MKMKSFIIFSAMAAMTFGTAHAYADKSFISEFDFEEIPTDHGWRTYDLDGKSTCFFGKPRGWYMAFDGDNGVCAATSLFNYDVDYDHFVTPVTVPANDWLFSAAVEIPALGSYELRWDACSGGQYDLEDIELRVIDFDLLNSLENSFTSSMSLKEVSDKMFENSESIGMYRQISRDWTTYSVDINRFRGRKVSFIWRYCSNHTQLIYLDNFKVVEQADRSFSVMAEAFPQLSDSYALVPGFMIGDELFSLKLNLMNVDSKKLSGVTSNVKFIGADDEIIYSTMFTPGDIEAGESKILAATPDNESVVSLIAQPYKMTVTTVSDGAFTDETTFVKQGGAEITDEKLAWETEYENFKSVGGSDANKQLGQRFPVWHDAMVRSVTFEIAPESTASQTRVAVYEVNDDDFILLDRSDAVAVDGAVQAVYTVELREPLKLSAGKTYFVSLSELGDEVLCLRSSTKDNGRIAASYRTSDNHWVEQGYGTTLSLALNLSEYVEAGISQVADTRDEADVTVADGVITVVGHGVYEIYALSGRMLACGVTDGSVNVSEIQAHGVYVVRINGKSFKIVI